MVNLTTLDDEVEDTSCILQPDDYPAFIEHATVVYYNDAKLWWKTGEKGFNEIQKAGHVTMMPPVSPATLLKVQMGALKSDFFTPDYSPRVEASLVRAAP